MYFTQKQTVMQLHPYLSFKGQCEDAFKFYEQHLGGTMGPLFRYAGTPLTGQMPAGWQDKVMHGSITLGEQTLMGADVAPEQYETPKGFSLTLQFTDVAAAERAFGALASDGQIVLPLDKTFWAERFGMLIDQFGIPWMINCGDAVQ